ncbi:MAG: nitroreductase family deazaflavin-dependent oxidoreductase [Acidimicrobiia bacterium]
MSSFNFKSKPTGFFKWILYTPVYLYRAHLGFVMGNRFLMIEHKGRKSGTLYRTVLEVAGQHPDRGEWISTSGTGPKADWYRNIREDGLEAVWLGSTRNPRANVRFLEAEESGGVFKLYEEEHPKASAKLMDSMGVSYDGTDQGRIDMMRQIPMVAFSW